MNRRSRAELDDKLEHLAGLLQLRIIMPGEAKPGLYIRFDGAQCRLFSNVEKQVSDKTDETVWVGVGVITERFTTVTKLHDAMDMAVGVISDFSLVKK